MTPLPRLRELRLARDWTQQELADAAGIHREKVAQYETGAARPSWRTALKLARALGCSLDEFSGISTAKL